jgi:CTP-dependent riboflavin kinase
MLRKLFGTVSTGFGAATPNLQPVLGLIEQRTGLGGLKDGTLNIRLTQSYIVKPNAIIDRAEYNRVEFLKLQRCRIRGTRGIIMRPNTHEAGYAHGPAHLEIMSPYHLRSTFTLRDGDEVEVEVEGDENWWGAPDRAA